MTEEQGAAYAKLSLQLRDELRHALAAGDHSLLGVVLNCLLAWPDCCFRPETVRHPHTRAILAQTPALFADLDAAPKESALIELCQANRAEGRRVLVYSTYSGTRDTTARLKALLDQVGFKVRCCGRRWRRRSGKTGCSSRWSGAPKSSSPTPSW